MAEVFVMLADSLKASHDVVDTMDILVQASTTFTSAVEAGIVLADTGGTLHVVASSSERTSEVEEAQLGINQGPCLECFGTGALTEVDDLRQRAEDWPDFVPLAIDRGFAADHAFPLRLRERTIGVINLFSDHPSTLTDQEVVLVQALANVATISLLQTEALQNQVAISDQLQRALESRVLIEQAKGVIAHQHGIGMDEAFALLRAKARNTGTKLRNVAELIVQRRINI